MKLKPSKARKINLVPSKARSIDPEVVREALGAEPAPRPQRFGVNMPSERQRIALSRIAEDVIVPPELG